jgi:hypothetical protein
MMQSDIARCESLHETAHGYTRANELRDALATGTPIVAQRDGRVRAYMAAPTIWLANHGVAETEEDMQALRSASDNETANFVPYAGSSRGFISLVSNGRLSRYQTYDPDDDRRVSRAAG